MGKILKALETYQDSDVVKVEILLPYSFVQLSHLLGLYNILD